MARRQEERQLPRLVSQRKAKVHPCFPGHGTYTSWYEDGQKWEEKHFVNGVLEGGNTKWHSNGTKEKQGSYVDNKKHGIWTTWDVDGNIIEQVEYVNGERKDE